MPDARTTRGTARAALLDAASRALATPTLADLLSFVHIRRLAADAGVSLGTASHHLSSGNARLAQVLAQHLLDPTHMPIIAETAEALDRAADLMTRNEPRAAITAVRAAAIRDIERYTVPGVPRHVMIGLASIAAARDEAAAGVIRAYFDRITEDLAENFGRLLRAWEREPVPGVDTERLAVVVTALADGFALRARFDRERATPEVFADSVLAITDGLTQPIRPSTSHESLESRLLPEPDPLSVDPHKRRAIEDATNTLYDQSGWEAVTVVAVAKKAGVDARTVKANFGDRAGLAAAIWTRFMPEIERALLADANQSIEKTIRRHFLRIAKLVVEHRPLSRALFAQVFAYAFEHGPPDYRDPTDLRTVVPLPVPLAEALLAHRAELRLGVADTPPAAIDLANFLTQSVLLRALTRPKARPRDVVDSTMNVCLAGVLR